MAIGFVYLAYGIVVASCALLLLVAVDQAMWGRD